MTSAERVQLDLMRRATPRERAAVALRLSDETIALARRAVARSWPELDEGARRLKLVELLYGPELARGLAARGVGS